MVKFVIKEAQDENQPDAVNELIQILTTDSHEETENYYDIHRTTKQQDLQQGREEGEHRRALAIAKNMHKMQFVPVAQGRGKLLCKYYQKNLSKKEVFNE